MHGTLTTTGPTNLTAAVFCRDLPALYDFVTSLNDIPAAEVTVVGSAVKRAGRRAHHPAARRGRPDTSGES